MLSREERDITRGRPRARPPARCCADTVAGGIFRACQNQRHSGDRPAAGQDFCCPHARATLAWSICTVRSGTSLAFGRVGRRGHPLLLPRWLTM